MRLFLSSLFILYCIVLEAQPVEEPIFERPHRYYTVKDGLSQGQPRNAFQDSKGFLWVTTKDGIDRFDGLEFVNYKTDTSFVRDRIAHIREDDHGNIYFSGRRALYIYNGIAFERKVWPASYAAPLILSIGDNQLVFQMHKSDLVFLRNDSFQIKKLPFPVEGATIESCLFINNEEEVIINYILPSGGQSLYSLKENRLQHLIKGTEIFPFSSYPLNYDQLNIRIEDSLFSYQNGQMEFEKTIPYLDNGSPFSSFHNELYWKQVGVIKHLNRTGKYETFFDDNHDISHVFPTPDFLYVASERGLIRVSINHALKYYSTDKGMPNTVWSFTEDKDGKIWFSSFADKSISYIDDNRIIPLDLSQYKHEWYFYPGATRVSNGKLWFPAGRNTVVVDPATQKTSLLNQYIARAVNYFTQKGSIIYAASNALYLYNEDHEQIARYADEDGLDMSTYGYLEVIAQDTSGKLWLGAHLGLANWDGKEFKNYYVNKELEGGVVAIKKDHRENLWFGTSNGVSFYDYSTELPYQIAKSSLSESVKFIEFIDTSYVLLGESGKLFFLDLPAFYRNEINIYTYNEDDGFSGEECLQNASFKDSKGHIWIGTTNGVIEMDPTKLKFYTAPTEPHFSMIRYINSATGEAVERRIGYGESDFTFTAKSTDQNFEFFYYTINHHKPKSITYRQRLRGYQDTWSLPRSPRFVAYNELPVGEYTFELQACLNDSCSVTKAFRVKITPGKWHEKMGFRLLMGGGLFLLLAGSIFQWRKGQQAQKRLAKREQENMALQLKQLTMRKNLAIHKIEPHFTFNVLTAISDLILQKDTKKALTYTARFANLFRPILAEQGVLFRSLQEEVNLIKDYIKLEKLRFPEKFDAEISVAEDVDLSVKVPFMVIHSFVSNAIKHGMEPLESGGIIELSFTQAKKILTVIITDNGVGRAETRRKTAQYSNNTGTSIASDILSFLNEYYPEQSSIEITDLNPGDPGRPGTKVIINFYTGFSEE